MTFFLLVFMATPCWVIASPLRRPRQRYVGANHAELYEHPVVRGVLEDAFDNTDVGIVMEDVKKEFDGTVVAAALARPKKCVREFFNCRVENVRLAIQLPTEMVAALAFGNFTTAAWPAPANVVRGRWRGLKLVQHLMPGWVPQRLQRPRRDLAADGDAAMGPEDVAANAAGDAQQLEEPTGVEEDDPEINTTQSLFVPGLCHIIQNSTEAVEAAIPFF